MVNTIYIHFPGIANHHGAPNGEGILHLAAEPKTFNLALRLADLFRENPDVTIIGVSDLALKPWCKHKATGGHDDFLRCAFCGTSMVWNGTEYTPR